MVYTRGQRDDYLTMVASIEWGSYHEAGHIVAAAVLKVPFRSFGIHIDGKGRGLCKLVRPSATCSDPFSEVERRQKRMIVVLFAGLLAQKRFCSDSPEISANCDSQQIELYLSAIYRTDPARQVARLYLEQESNRLVYTGPYWDAIEGVATELLAQPFTPIVSGEWHTDRTEEKMLEGIRIVDILDQHRIAAATNDVTPDEDPPWGVE